MMGKSHINSISIGSFSMNVRPKAGMRSGKVIWLAMSCLLMSTRWHTVYWHEMCCSDLVIDNGRTIAII